MLFLFLYYSISFFKCYVFYLISFIMLLFSSILYGLGDKIDEEGNLANVLFYNECGYSYLFDYIYLLFLV